LVENQNKTCVRSDQGRTFDSY